MQNKLLLYIGGAILIAAILILSGIFLTSFNIQQQEESPQKTSLQGGEVILAPEVEVVLDRRIALLGELFEDPTIVNEVKKSNQKNKDISLKEILELDKRWRGTEGVDEFIEPFLTNEIARKLIEFQETYPGFSEIFVVDMYGLNVGQTNKTTDYYQADEDWWIGAYNSGKGKASHGVIEFDESAQTEAISVYIPVMDETNNKAIGVIKAVVSIAAIKMDL